ncbi:bone morphogenetic protein 10 [Triplophysa dalaica]|uniref:bone morphogenetic protein 10 n=1 Tax=Triplophysa dalaica TaxID=1582913 RepID=UPI0024DF9D24|nr:bone morphogenetic protein 10 [Triplophysa dalaica]WUV41738.1 BMP10b [Triplophysa dalaica]
MGPSIASVFLAFLVLFWGPFFACSNPISSPERIRTGPGLDDGNGGVLDPSLLEQDSEVDMQSVLETLKGQFLRTFNLSGIPPPVKTGATRVEPPEYMMELYNRFANDRTSMPSANIVRSFKNEDSSPCSVGPGGVRQHPLLFNVSIPHHERVTAAELRLYTLVQTDRHKYAGVDRKVTIYEVKQRETNASHQIRGDDIEEETELVELASRQVYGTDNGWESFDMTAAVLNWRAKSEYGTTHKLEVHIASLNSQSAPASEGENTGNAIGGAMDIDTSLEDKHRPLMIVFSDDQSVDHRGDKRELNELIQHETAGRGFQDNLGLGLTDLWDDLGQNDENEEEEQSEEALLQMRSNLIYDTASRIRRNAKGNLCKKNPLYVDFKDIGWDSWILAPTGYEAYECAGVCTYPLTKHVTPTKHAIVQTLVNLKSPQKVARACCVPTKLDSISLLYLDDAGVVTYQYKYEGMVVSECGCR